MNSIQFIDGDADMRPQRDCIPCPERDAYVDLAREDGCSEITARCKNRYIDEFVRFCIASDPKFKLAKITPEHVTKFAAHLYDTAFLRNTASAKLAAILSWIRWLRSKGTIRSGDFAAVTAPSLLKQLHSTKKKPTMSRGVDSRVAKAPRLLSKVQPEFDDDDDD